MPYDPGSDVIEVVRHPPRNAAASTYRIFGETLRGMKTTFARVVEGPLTIQYPEEKTPVYPRFRGRHKLHRFESSDPAHPASRSASAARSAPPPARPTASAWSPPRTRRRTACPPASATPPSTRST